MFRTIRFALWKIVPGVHDGENLCLMARSVPPQTDTGLSGRSGVAAMRNEYL